MGRLQNKTSNSRLIVKAVQVQIQGEIKTFSVISLKNRLTGVEAVHPVTQFIFHYWKNHRYYSMRKHAYCIANFLNFAFFDNSFRYRLRSLAKIELMHVMDYLNELGETNSRQDVIFQRNTLTKFLYYLSKYGLLDNITLDSFEIVSDRYAKNRVTCNYNELILPNRRTSNLIHQFDTKLVIPFLRIALSCTPRIAFGVYLQIFGGCRIGDVVNLRRCDITPIGDAWGSYGLSLKIEEHNMRPNAIRSGSTIGVKKPRQQVVIAYKDWIGSLWKTHLDRFRPTDKSDALFVNTRRMAMTKNNYRYEFEKLKRCFICWLKKQGTELTLYAQFLETHKWSTHIGRGIFSTLLAKEAKTILDIAVLRGDSNYESSLTYLGQSPQILVRLQESVQRMHELFRDFE